MKVLYIDNIIERRTNPLVTQYWLDQGYTVGIAANLSRIEKSLQNASITYHQIDLHRHPLHFGNIRAFVQMSKLLAKEKYDLIHCNSPVGGLLGRLCGALAGIPKIIYTAHGFHFYKGAPLVNILVFKRVEQLLARYTDGLITINKEDFGVAQGFKLRTRGQVYYIPGVGIDTSVIQLASGNRNKILSEIGAEDDSILLISVGELNKNKNNQIIVRALGALNNSKIHYLLCGVGSEKDELMLLARTYGLEANIHFLGYRNDIPQLLKSCDIFILPSYREGLPRSLMEAMAAGLPCIVSRIRGNVDLIEDVKGGFLREPEDVDGMKEAISILSSDNRLRSKMGIANLEIIKRFDVKEVKNELAKIYRNIHA